MDRVNFDDKIHDILSEISRFQILSVDIATYILKLANKLNGIFESVKDAVK